MFIDNFDDDNAKYQKNLPNATIFRGYCQSISKMNGKMTETQQIDAAQ